MPLTGWISSAMAASLLGDVDGEAREVALAARRRNRVGLAVDGQPHGIRVAEHDRERRLAAHA